VCHASAASAQPPPPSPWTGIAANEARPDTPQQYGQGSNEMTSHAMSADGRFVVFDSNLSHLVYGDVNGFNDVFMRDRQTGELSLISRANDGSQGNSYSAWPTISANGRYVAFNSCASNFVPADTNGCDIFIRDHVSGTIVRGNVGPNGEQATITTQHAFRLSGDGRYLVFVGDFDPDLDQAKMPVWLRDRDSDGNGVFDEPGTSTTTQVSQSTFGDYSLQWLSEVAISNDGRWIAYTAETHADDGHFIGTHIYLYDPAYGTTALIDRTTVGTVDEYSYASGPDFSDAGHLAYSSNANNLTESDSGYYDYDVFVFNVLTGGNTLVPTHAGETGLIYVWSPAISADGRYVAYTKATPDEWGWQYQYNIYAADRQTGFSTAISRRPDGTLDNNTGAPSISADGLSIAFHANPEMLVWAWGNVGIFVATGVDLTPAHIDVPAEGGTFSIDVTVPQGIAWTLTPTGMNVSQDSGVGPATIDVTLPANTLPDEQDYVVALGSKQVTLHQALAPQISWVWPYEGSPHGGTEVTINGANFADGATVAFDGVPATNVVFLGSTTLHATTPAHPVGFVDVTVTNPGGASVTFQWGFNYVDDTPPVVTYEVAGTLGQNGYYTSDVQVTFHYEDLESEIYASACASPFLMNWDAAYAFAICNVTSQGGQTVVDVDVKRDTVAPRVVMAPAYPEEFAQGQQVPIAIDCSDDTSGIASCTSNQQGPNLDTSAVGTFVFAVTGVDLAGHSTTTSVNYTVKMLTGITVPVVSAVYGNATAALRATLTGPSNPVPGKTITFFVDNVAVGTAVTAANGEAVFNYPLAGRNAGSWEMHAEFAGDDTAFANMMPSALEIAKATPVVTWANPSFIVAGTPLGSTQLNATASVSGSFNYTPGFSTVLSAGLHTLSVLFVPQDAANYEVASATVSLKVKGIPVITWPSPAAITYLTGLTGTQLNATANVAGNFVYTPPFGTLLDAGTQTLSVTFTPTNTADYVSESSTTTIVVNKANATINWPFINPISYGTPLSGLQLNATTYADGSITYAPDYGTILTAGMHTLTATFNPNPPYNYNPATATRDILVGKAYPVVYWQGDLAPIVYGTALTSAQLYATSPNAGTITYNPPAGTLLAAGLRTISMTFTPDDTANYNTVTYTKDIAVDKQTTTITWGEPQSIVYGTALSATQLNATASQPGTFSYDPPLGTLLSAGPHQLSVYFAPTNPNYYGGTWYVTLLVTKRTPTITWNTPAPIVYGTALSNTQLNASANTQGSFTYTPAAGTVLSAGSQLLVVTFEPSDPFNYNAGSGSATIVVNKATPVITWHSPGGIYYGTPLSGAQLGATANVSGTFDYSPPAGTVLDAGEQTLSTTFTPNDSINYAGTTATITQTIVPAGSGLAWPQPAAIPYPTPLSAAQLNATAASTGTFNYSEPLGTVLTPGVHAIELNFTPDTNNYQSGTIIRYLTVTQTTPVITWAAPATIAYPTPLSATQLNATASVPGTFNYQPGAGALLAAGTQNLSVIFHATDTNYDVASATVSITVTKGTPVVSWTTPANITYGNVLSNGQLNATANVAGTFGYTPPAGTLLNAGPQTLSVTFTPYDTSYNPATASVTLNVNKATPALSWAQPSGIQYGTALSSTQYNASASVAGSFVYSPPAGTIPHVGGVTMTATFTPSDTVNYNAPGPISKTIFVSKAPLTLQVNNAGKVYGQALPVFSTTGTGFVNGDTLASVANPPFYNTTATATSAPGNYSVTLSGYSSVDYTITALAGTLTVTKAATSVAFTTTPNPSNNNQQVQLRAVVSAVAPGAGTATGTVEFRENGSLFATATVVNGVATLGKNFKRGSHALTAVYLGDANFTGSTGSITHQVQ
jgi:hypothetical protein